MSQTPPATPSEPATKTATSGPLQAEPPNFPRQRYSLSSRVRANLYGRGTLILESLIALLLLAAVLSIDIWFFETHYANEDLPAALVDSFKLLTLQGSLTGVNGGLSEGLFIFNVLFSVLFIQSVLNTVRALISKRSPQVRQLGLAATCRNQVIVCGLGRMGQRVITRLVESGTDVVVIERDFQSEMVPRALEMRVPVVVGEAQEAQVLHQAGISRARAIIACIDGDLTDVEIALAARAERSDIRVILRAFNEDFDRGLERSFGEHTAFSASALAAPTFAAALLSRDIEHVLPLGNDLLGISQFRISSGVKISGSLQSLEDSYNVRVIYQSESSGRPIRYNPKHVLASGEVLTVIGQIRSLEALRGAGLITESSSRYPVLLVPTEQRNRVVICGFGKVGYRVVHWLSQWQLHIAVIYKDDDDEHTTFTEQASSLPGIEFIRGDARKNSVLRRAGIEQALAIAAVTSDDLTNLRIGLEARRIRPDVHVVLRVFNDALAQKLPYLFGIHTAYSTSDLASTTLAAAAVIGGISHAFPGPRDLFALEERLVVALDRLSGERISALRKQQAHVIGLRRAGVTTIFPAADTILAPGDTVEVVAPLPALVRLRDH
ncbi:MAG: potassium channel family protein [Ktedonobacterales bacterium]